MDKNLKLVSIAGIIAFILALTIVFIKKNQKPPDATVLPQIQYKKSEPLKNKDDVLKGALNLYIAKKQQGVDFSKGPCLGTIASDWVLDIAHNPRQAIDEKSENQCADFKEGRAHHFIELDPQGNLIGAF